MVTQLIRHERIETTLPRAKELRRLADQVVTLAKEDSLASRRALSGIVNGEEELHKLFTVLAPRYADRQGGYVRVLASGNRTNDRAKTALIEYVDRDGELRAARTPTNPFLNAAARAALHDPTA